MNTFAAILAMLLAAQQAAAVASEAKTEIEPLEPYRYSYTSDAVPPDFSGREIGILVSSPDNSSVLPDERSGDMRSDNLYDSRIRTEDLFNVRLTETDMPGNEAYNAIRRDILAGDSVYDMMFLEAGYMTQLLAQGMLYDFGVNKSTTIDPEKPWWNPSATEDIAYKDRTYYALPDILPDSLDNMPCVYFDRETFGDSLYELAESGKWTLDEMLKALADKTIDLDGAAPLFHAAGESLLVKVKEEDTLTLAPLSERMMSVADKISALFGKKNESEDTKGVFSVSTVGKASEYEGYGILPLPKFDKKDEYVTPMPNDTRLFSISMTTTDMTAAETVADALAYNCRAKLEDNFYDILTPIRDVSEDGTYEYVRDEDLGMLAAMYNSRKFDILDTLGLAGGLDYDDAILNGFAARFEMNRKKIAKAIDKFIYSLEEIN